MLSKIQLFIFLKNISNKLQGFFEKWIRMLPSVKKEISIQTKSVINNLQPLIKPYAKEHQTYYKLPTLGVKQEKIFNEIKKISEQEQTKWQNGYVSGAVYHGDQKHIEFLNNIYALQSQSNPLHTDLFPSASKFESEIISMTANLLNANKTNDDVCGVVTSGGTESILLAMKTYRDRARDLHSIYRPNIVLPVTAHAAFDKAAEYFNIKIKRIPVDKHFKANINSLKKAINGNTICIIGSAPNFPQGTIDPIEEMSEISRKLGICFHVDACLGGFILPFAEELGYDVKPFDFRLPGVTSISTDTHKYGYASKGTSVILYRNYKIREYQYFTISDWPGGLYFSPTFAGSRPGALSAVSWAAMITMGKNGYKESAKNILKVANDIKKGINKIEELNILGSPLWVIAFESNQLDIYKIMDQMTIRNWNLNGLHKPSCIHLCVTLRHTQKGVSEKFLSDLKESISYVKKNPTEIGNMAPVYGMAASIPFRGVIKDLLKKYMNLYYKA